MKLIYKHCRKCHILKNEIVLLKIFFPLSIMRWLWFVNTLADVLYRVKRSCTCYFLSRSTNYPYEFLKISFLKKMLVKFLWYFTYLLTKCHNVSATASAFVKIMNGKDFCCFGFTLHLNKKNIRNRRMNFMLYTMLMVFKTSIFW